MTAYYNEFDPYAAAWLRNLITAGHIAPGDVDERSIVDVRPDDLKGYTQVHFFAGIGGWSLAARIAGWPDDRPIWSGSCPCQPFSAAGKRKGFDDARHLWPVFRDLIAERRPAVVFGEQVAAAADWLRLVRSDLEAMGRAVGAIPIEAASAGADHLRDRFWFVADAACERRQWAGGVAPSGQPKLTDDHLGNGGGARLALRPLTEDQRGDVRHEGATAAAPGDRSNADGVGDASGAGGRRDARTVPGAQGEGAGERSVVGCVVDEPQSTGTADGDVAISEGERRPDRDGRPLQGAVERERPAQQLERRGGDDGAVVDAARLGRREGRPEHELRSGRSAVAEPSSAFDWVIGADGKARRVKPGVRLLVDGFPGRVGLLRGFGNAIDPRPAAAFITAYMQARGLFVTPVSEVSSDGDVFA